MRALSEVRNFVESLIAVLIRIDDQAAEAACSQEIARHHDPKKSFHPLTQVNE